MRRTILTALLLTSVAWSTASAALIPRTGIRPPVCPNGTAVCPGPILTAS